MSSLPGYDQWLAGYRHERVEAWCENRACVAHRESIEVDYETEYGQGWITPETCPVCHKGELTLDEPDDEEGGDDE